MSTITKEQAQSVSDLKAGYTLGHADVEILNDLARIALASLEAEAVHQVLTGDTWVDLSKGATDSQKRVDAIVRTLYTAPPAPVSVPDEMEMDDDFDSAFEHGKAVGWNACRAAMIQGAEPVMKANKSPERWVAVPVDMDSEMMRAVQVNSELGAYACANLAGAYSLFREFYDAAIAARPKNLDKK
jgi:hypothetical protein